jgi:glutamate synthase domain-containing protein 2
MVYYRRPGFTGGLGEEDWLRTDVAWKAVMGRDALYPPDVGVDFLPGLSPHEPQGRGLDLDDLVLVPPLFTPLRLKRMVELGREPLFTDVDTTARIGGFKARLPVLVASMGSSSLANRRRLTIAAGAARAGAIMGIGENVVTVRGYDKRLTDEPCLKEAMMAYLTGLSGGNGGLLIQQSVEDANFELWNKVYSDPDLEDFFAKGLVGFEIKIGQGAKPGLGGEIRIPRDMALRLAKKFYFPDDPETVIKEKYVRHSAPGTFMPDILEEMVGLAKNNYPRARIWLKTGPYRDLEEQLEVARRAGADALAIDGAEGGTGMSPATAMADLGLPAIACLREIARARSRGNRLDTILSGGLWNGGHVVKSLALGATAVAMGRPFIIAATGKAEFFGEPGGLEDPVEGVVNFLEATLTEVQMLTSALGKYSISQLDRGDLQALSPELATAFSIPYVYSKGP